MISYNVKYGDLLIITGRHLTLSFLADQTLFYRHNSYLPIKTNYCILYKIAIDKIFKFDNRNIFGYN